MIVIFNEARLDVIDQELEAADNGDQDARRRIIQIHLPWLLHFARHTNEQVAEYEADMVDEVVVEEAGIENVENAEPEVAELATDLLEDENVASVTIGDVEDDQDSVAEAGSPTALAEDAAIAETNVEENFVPFSGALEVATVEDDTLLEGEEGNAPEKPEESSPSEAEANNEEAE